jgi:hypothetical protein
LNVFKSGNTCKRCETIINRRIHCAQKYCAGRGFCPWMPNLPVCRCLPRNL